MADMAPKTLFHALGDAFPPSEQQAAVVGAAPGPMLVVAGAGAGKTKTMADRVVWLVANGYARPEEVLGLTFTRKAAQELGRRVRRRLQELANNEGLLRRLDPSGELAKRLEVIAPKVATYDSYAGDLVREYGLLVPVEPDSRLITAAELHAIATDVVRNYRGQLIPQGASSESLDDVVNKLLALSTAIGNELAEPEQLYEAATIFLQETEALPRPEKSRTKGEFTVEVQNWRNKQVQRQLFLPLVAALRQELRERGVVTFTQQMSIASQMVRDHDRIGVSQRQRFRVVMLDEYQDTSHSQRVLLRSLFGQGADPTLTVTAVGDPMQSIYGWRGATAANLEAFVHDFPLTDGQPAPKRQLTISWRNPQRALALANSISGAILGKGPDRVVAELEPREGAQQGDITLGFFDQLDEEITFVADNLAQQYQQRDPQVPFTAAVLLRKNRQALPIAQALEERGVPYEIVGLGGLLSVPEVADTVALATMLVRPYDSQAALRILGGPAVQLGLADLIALADRAKNLDGGGEVASTSEPGDAESHYAAELAALAHDAEALQTQADKPAGLGDAVADLGEPERYSEEGLARLKQFAAKLRELRKYSLGKRLGDVFADIIDVFNIRAEVLARNSATGTVHLDKLLTYVDEYPGTSLENLLDYFALAAETEDGLEPGAVRVSTDCVQLLTVHKAKGLEWDTVAVMHADGSTYAAKASTFLTNTQVIPDPDFGDPDIYEEFAEVETRSDFGKAGKAWIKRIRAQEAEEAARLFYVAVTRTERKLLVTASRYAPGKERETPPYEHFEALRNVVDPSCIVEPQPTDSATPAAPVANETAVGYWPLPAAETPVQGTKTPSQLVIDAAAQLASAPAEGELYSLWERDATALIEEHEAAQLEDVPVMLPGELTASDVVALSADREQFARRARRPVPFKPNQYAKRGTAFHEWIEDFYGQRPLLTEDELPGIDEQEVDPAVLAKLKENFEASHWARRTPTHIEAPFELALGTSVVRGRMDAVFEEDDGWVVVDWKTGKKPSGAEMEAAKLQLAVYQEAWKRIAADNRPVRAVFFYVRSGEDFTATSLPDAQELGELLRNAGSAKNSGTVTRRTSGTPQEG